MKTERPLILISNDDGVTAKGLKCLIGMLRPLADLVVMAPDAHRSGASCSISAGLPVGYREVCHEDGLAVYACTGTPIDCVKLALQEVVCRCPDLMVSGINHGDNSAINVHYSGTMGAVFEGCMKGIPSIGFSLCDHSPDADFLPLTACVQSLVYEVLIRGLPERVCLNVNFPKATFFRGVKICRQTRGSWEGEWESAHNPHGQHYFWLTGRFRSLENEDDILTCEARNEKVLWPDTVALNSGYVSVTPTRIDVTDYDQVRAMQDWSLAF